MRRSLVDSTHDLFTRAEGEGHAATDPYAPVVRRFVDAPPERREALPAMPRPDDGGWSREREDDLVRRVVDQLEQRVVDELERRGRRFPAGGY